ncbi:MAG: hypothetical protein GY700_09925, partial [Propionibacteriaceae bacterium]|nr:hypothetical protein [Propionibacteriaceae bacterium]
FDPPSGPALELEGFDEGLYVSVHFCTATQRPNRNRPDHVIAEPGMAVMTQPAGGHVGTKSQTEAFKDLTPADPNEGGYPWTLALWRRELKLYVAPQHAIHWFDRLGHPMDISSRLLKERNRAVQDLVGC